MAQRLDSYGKYPSGMQEYLEMYGWSCSKKMAEWAIGKMVKTDPATKTKKPIDPWSKEQVDEMLKKYGIKLEKDNGYDSYWCANMAKSDFFKSSLPDEQRVAMFVRDFIDDEDAPEGKCLTYIYAMCIAKGVIIPWLDLV